MASLGYSRAVICRPGVLLVPGGRGERRIPEKVAVYVDFSLRRRRPSLSLSLFRFSPSLPADSPSPSPSSPPVPLSHRHRHPLARRLAARSSLGSPSSARPTRSRRSPSAAPSSTPASRRHLSASRRRSPVTLRRSSTTTRRASSASRRPDLFVLAFLSLARRRRSSLRRPTFPSCSVCNLISSTSAATSCAVRASAARRVPWRRRAEGLSGGGAKQTPKGQGRRDRDRRRRSVRRTCRPAGKARAPRPAQLSPHGSRFAGCSYTSLLTARSLRESAGESESAKQGRCDGAGFEICAVLGEGDESWLAPSCSSAHARRARRSASLPAVPGLGR